MISHQTIGMQLRAVTKQAFSQHFFIKLKILIGKKACITIVTALNEVDGNIG
jgi:hypothetical protein